MGLSYTASSGLPRDRAQSVPSSGTQVSQQYSQDTSSSTPRSIPEFSFGRVALSSSTAVPDSPPVLHDELNLPDIDPPPYVDRARLHRMFNISSCDMDTVKSMIEQGTPMGPRRPLPMRNYRIGRRSNEVGETETRSTQVESVSSVSSGVSGDSNTTHLEARSQASNLSNTPSLMPLKKEGQQDQEEEDNDIDEDATDSYVTVETVPTEMIHTGDEVKSIHTASWTRSGQLTCGTRGHDRCFCWMYGVAGGVVGALIGCIVMLIGIWMMGEPKR